MSGFVYQSRSQEAIHRRATAKGGDFASFLDEQFPGYKAYDGENWIRPLPPSWEGATHYGYEVWVHYRVGGTTDCLCLRHMQNKKCPVCEYMAGLERDGLSDTDEYKSARARQRVVCWIIDRKAENKGPLLYDMPFTLDQEITKVTLDRRTGQYYEIDHPDHGMDVIFEKSGTGRNTQYLAPQLDRQTTSVDPAYLDWVSEHPLPTVVIFRDYATVKSLLQGGMDEEPSYGANGGQAPEGRWAPPGGAPQRAPMRQPQAPVRQGPPQRGAAPQRAPQRAPQQAQANGGWRPPVAPQRAAPAPQGRAPVAPQRAPQRAAPAPEYQEGYDPQYDQAGYDPAGGEYDNSYQEEQYADPTPPARQPIQRAPAAPPQGNGPRNPALTAQQLRDRYQEQGR